MDTQSAIAIVGMGLRFPGADDKHEFWENLRDGVDSVVTATTEELLERGAAPEDIAKPNYVRRVTRPRDVASFDAGFFSFTGRQAQLADPQLRLLLEVCQEAAEDSGHILTGSRTGVYVGVADNGHWPSRLGHFRRVDKEPLLSDRIYTGKDYFATQVSHKLNLLGPSVSVSAACSSGLVAVHEAATHLLMHECDFAIAGACEVDRGLGYLYEEGGILSPDGYCRSFDASARGTIFGSGAGVVVLRRYEDAIRDRDPIYAVLLATRLNNDGREKAAFTAPSVNGQSDVVLEAIAAAGIQADDISYVEAHATGTPVGDPIEIQGLNRAFRHWTQRRHFCAIGAVKTNIGHLSIAAGIAGLIKTTLSLQHRQIPPTLHFTTPNPAIDFEDSPFYVTVQLKDWNPSGRPRIAGVSSFGIGGTNAHAILREAPERESSGSSRPYQVLTVTGRSREAMLANRANLIRFLDENPQAVRADVAYTLHVGRADMLFRSALVCPEAGASAEVSDTERWKDDSVEAKESPQVCFMFPGQGSQHESMARGLYTHEPYFREIVDRCASLLREHLGRDIRELLFPTPELKEEAQRLLTRTEYAQPALFTVSYATARLLQSWGIQPTRLIGHSIGEYVAACLAGVFSLWDCLRIVAVRGRLMQSMPPGQMVSVAAPAEAVAPLLASGVEISVVNGPEFCVIGGSEAALEAVLPKLRDANLRCQKLATSHAFHTWMMQDMLAEFRRTVAEVERSTPKIPFVSNVTGAMITDSQASDPEYWVSHVRNTVRFGEGIQTLVKSGTDVFVEVGPGTTLTALLREAGIAGISLLRHPRTTHNDNAVLMQGLAELWIRGVKVDWTAFHMHETRNRLSLPTYAFQRRHHWPEPPPALTPAAAALTRKAVHPLLGQRWSTSARIKAYENFISATEPGYLKDHSVMDVTIFPAAGYCEMALAAARLELGTRPVRIDRIQFVRPLLLRAGETRTIQTSVLRRSKDTWEFEILGRTRDRQHPEEDAWVVHSEGTFSALSDALPRTELAQLRERITTPDSLEFYSAELIQYGPAFRGVSQVFRDGEEILARIELPEACRASTGYQFHPVLLDSSFQAVGAYTFGQSLTGEMLPVGLRQWDVYEPMPPSFWAYIKIDRDLSRGRSAAALRGLSFCFYGDDGRVLSRIGKYERKELDRQSLSEKSAPEELLYEIAWEEKERPAPAARNPGRTVFILTDDLPAADLLTRELATATGDEVVTKQYSPGHDAVESLARTCATNPVDVVMVGLCRSERAPGVLCEVLLRVVQTLSEAAHGATLTLVTAGAQRVAGVSGGSLSAVAGGLLWGFGSAVVKEHPDLQCLRVDLDPDVAFDPAAVVAELLGSRDESLVGLRGFTRYVARLTRLQKAAAPSADTGQFRVLPDEFGTFDSLQPRPSTAGELGHDEVEVELYVGALNFKETLIVLGMLPYGDGTPAGVRLGCEGSGRIVRTGSSVTRFAVGDDVIVWRNGCLASHIVANENELLRFDPRRLSFEQAACLPTVCMTAHLGLETYGKLRRGERVLIHAAAGGVGLAAVQLARALGAEIYATASREKWDFLRRQGIRHVFDSRSTGFADEVLRATGGKGVHLVLNSLAGDFIRKGFDILTEGGRFIELGKLDIWSQDEARNYRPDVSYVAFELGVGEARGPHMMEKVLGPQLSRMLEGSLEPLPAKVYSLADVASAFRRLAAGQTIGKVAIRIRDVPARRGNRDIRPDGAYVISGGSGALGLHVAEWLVEKGAREIVLLSRRAAEHETNPDVGRLRDSGAVVRLAQCDVADRGELAEVLEAVSDVAGVFHCAGILDDGVIQNQTRQRFDVVLQPKIAGVRNLHELTVSRGLDHFVCFSSTSALLDGGGQSNYAAANAYLDAFVAWRRRQGLPGVAIAWGGWSGGGMATRLAERRPGESGDLLSKEEGIEALEVLIERDVAQAICTKMGSRLAKEGGSLLYSRLNESNTATQAQATAVSSETLSRLDASSSAEELNRLLKQEIGKVLGLGADLVSDDTDFIDAGIDSLTMAELRNRINKVLPTPISAAAIFANSTVNALSAHIRGVLQSAPARDSTMTAPKQPQTDVGVVVLGPKHNERRLFCIPGIGNNIFEFQHLSESGLQATICVLPRDGQGAPNGVDEITWSASQNLKRMKDVSSHGPYALVGYSFGGTIAVEMAHQLIQAGEEVASLTLIDAIPWRSDDAERFERATYSAMFDTLFEALGVPESTSTAFYQRIKGLANSHALSQFREVIADVKTSDRLQATFADQMFEEFSRTARIRYTPPTRLGDLRITLCKAKRHLDAISRWTGTTVLDPRLKGRAYGWDGILANEIDVVDVDCSHFAIVRRPAVDPVVQTLRAALAGSVQ